MAFSSASIANEALSHLGVEGVITTLATDTTTEGKACYTHYASAVRETLAAADWRCANRRATLTLVETFAATDEQEWTFSYRLPENCLVPRRVVWGVRNPQNDQQFPFDTRPDEVSTTWNSLTSYAVGDYAQLEATGVWYRCILAHSAHTPPNGTYWIAAATASGGPPLLLVTDREDAVLEYTQDLTDPTRFDVGLASAIAARLAYAIAPRITVNGSAEALRNAAGALWQTLIAQAIVTDFNARQRDPQPMSGYQMARYRGGR